MADIVTDTRHNTQKVALAAQAENENVSEYILAGILRDSSAQQAAAAAITQDIKDGKFTHAQLQAAREVSLNANKDGSNSMLASVAIDAAKYNGNEQLANKIYTETRSSGEGYNYKDTVQGNADIAEREAVWKGQEVTPPRVDGTPDKPDTPNKPGEEGAPIEPPHSDRLPGGKPDDNHKPIIDGDDGSQVAPPRGDGTPDKPDTPNKPGEEGAPIEPPHSDRLPGGKPDDNHKPIIDGDDGSQVAPPRGDGTPDKPDTPNKPGEEGAPIEPPHSDRLPGGKPDDNHKPIIDGDDGSQVAPPRGDGTPDKPDTPNKPGEEGAPIEPPHSDRLPGGKPDDNHKPIIDGDNGSPVPPSVGTPDLPVRDAINEQIESTRTSYQNDLAVTNERIDNLEAAFEQQAHQLNELDERMDGVTASMHAITNARPFVQEGEFAMGAGVGFAGSKEALALGGAMGLTDNLSASFTVNYETSGTYSSSQVSGGAGLQYTFK
ncbi:hypothetical protein VB10N_35840 [Vibrio sp. 10N]|nr:hypothetical protein VB10N_35840 [Vibrio sp. 10N]